MTGQSILDANQAIHEAKQMNREAIITSMEANLPTNFREISVEWKNKAADAIIALQTPQELAAGKMYKELIRLRDYTLDILTGPVAQVVNWPEDFPESHPIISKINGLLDGIDDATLAKATRKP